MRTKEELYEAGQLVRVQIQHVNKKIEDCQSELALWKDYREVLTKDADNIAKETAELYKEKD